MRRPWRDGTTHVLLDPLTFIGRLAALVPPPRAHLLTYHGVLAPASSWRDAIVPDPPAARRANGRADEGSRYLWAELMRRVLGIDVLRCPACGRQRKLIALIMAPAVIERILTHLGLDSRPTPLSPARAPPQLELAF